MGDDRKNVLTGIIASRTCPLCGHHEIGFVSLDGEFHALKPGMAVQIQGPTETDPLPSEEKPVGLGEVSPPENMEGRIPWAPSPVLSKKGLRMKYAVRIRPDHAQEMSSEIYRFAYLEKLRNLIEKEIWVPLPVVLDRFFTAPHLASGNPLQVAEAMWRELSEVREPVRRVEEWLITGESSVFAEELESKNPGGEISREHEEGEDILKELEDLSLEDFLALL